MSFLPIYFDTYEYLSKYNNNNKQVHIIICKNTDTWVEIPTSTQQYIMSVILLITFK